MSFQTSPLASFAHGHPAHSHLPPPSPAPVQACTLCAGQKPVSGKKRKKAAADAISALGLDTAALDNLPSPGAQAASLARQAGVLELMQQLLVVRGLLCHLTVPLRPAVLISLQSFSTLPAMELIAWAAEHLACLHGYCHLLHQSCCTSVQG